MSIKPCQGQRLRRVKAVHVYQTVSRTKDEKGQGFQVSQTVSRTKVEQGQGCSCPSNSIKEKC